MLINGSQFFSPLLISSWHLLFIQDKLDLPEYEDKIDYFRRQKDRVDQFLSKLEKGEVAAQDLVLLAEWENV